MALTDEQRRLREGKVTAGFLPYLMAGKTDRIRQEWMRLVGHEALVEPDFESMWNLHYGSVVEPIALDWHEKKTGEPLVRRGEVVNHPSREYVCCTLDAYRAADDLVLDCKAWSSWQKIDYICSFLTPQMIGQRGCTGARRAALLIVHGGTEPVEYPLEWSADYEAQVWAAVDEFWRCVCDLQCPVEMPAKLAPIPATKEIDMSSSNLWANDAALWLEHRQSALTFKSVETELKSMVKPDVKRAHGHGVEIIRDRANRMTVREWRA